MCLAGFEVYGACIDLSKPAESVATNSTTGTVPMMSNDSTPIIRTEPVTIVASSSK